MSRRRSPPPRAPQRAGLTIAEGLLDERALAGIGNEVKNVVLWEGRLSPWTLLRDVDDAELRGLVSGVPRSSASASRPAAGDGRPRPRRAPVPAMRDDRAGEGARRELPTPHPLVPGPPAGPGEGAMSDEIDVRCEPTGDDWTAS